MPASRPLIAVFAAALIAPALAGAVTSSAFGTAPASSAVASADLGSSTAFRVRQSAKLFMHPQIADPGSTARSAAKAKVAMTAQFKPKKKRRVVQLQKKKGTSWVTIKKAKQNGAGRVEFVAPFKVKRKIQKYRVRAVKFDGFAVKASKGVSANKWGKANFTDQFSGAALNADVWSDRGLGYAEASQRKCSKADPRARSVGQGTLRLRVMDDPDRNNTLDRCQTASHGTHDYRLNGHVGTQGAKSFQYGYAAARVKFQPSRGQHGAFWLQPNTSTATNPGAEIDVIEYFGDKHPQGGLTSFIYQNGNKYPDGFIKRPGRFGDGWSSKYHVFSVEWTKKRYIFRIDGKETLRVNQGISHTPEYLILSHLSSDYELSLLEGKLPQTMHVDWVRYWER